MYYNVTCMDQRETKKTSTGFLSFSKYSLDAHLMELFKKKAPNLYCIWYARMLAGYLTTLGLGSWRILYLVKLPEVPWPFPLHSLFKGSDQIFPERPVPSERNT